MSYVVAFLAGFIVGFIIVTGYYLGWWGKRP